MENQNNMLIPSRKNIEKIFKIYKNECSFHDCSKKIIDLNNTVNGRIIFIESNKKDHPRYNPNLTNLEMIDYTNLIIFCYDDCYEVEKDSDRFPAKSLKIKLDNDSKNLSNSDFKLSDEMYKEFLHHFIEYYDPDRLSHIRFLEPDECGRASIGGDIGDVLVSQDDVRIRPTRHYAGGKFEIIDTGRKIQEFDEVIFYPVNSSLEKGIQVDIEIKSSMNIHGSVPNLQKGDYFVTIVSALDPTSKLENDLKFTVL